MTLAGRELLEYRQDDVRSAIAVAGQESYLFSATIRENVALARPGAGDEAIERALRRARRSGTGSRRSPGESTPASGSAAASSQAVSGSGSCSPARYWPTDRCSCSTSPPRTSIPAPRAS